VPAGLAAGTNVPELAPDVHEGFRTMLDQLLDDDLRSWGQMRSDTSDTPAGFDEHLIKPAEVANLEKLLASRKPSALD
jgi:hypothetical protein